MIKVFISYSHDSDEHIAQVFSFTDQLRKDGIEALIDQVLKQEETAIDFYRMMHRAITQSEKIIIVLSRGYKAKANDFIRGVGKEYSMIIKDIDNQPKKYILVSFQGLSDEITPMELFGREVIDLSPSQRSKSFERLLRKILDKPEFQFNTPTEKQLNLSPKKINPFFDGDFSRIINIDNKNN